MNDIKLVILGCGYLGYNIAERLKNEHYNITVIGLDNEYTMKLDSDIKYIAKDLMSIDDLSEHIFADAVIINAVGSINSTNSIMQLRDDIDYYRLYYRIVMKLNKCNTRKFIQLSSGGTVYGDATVMPISEEMPLKPVNIYGLQKVFFEHLLEINYLENKKLDYVIVRVSNPYGGYQSLNKNQGLIPITIKKALNGEMLDLWTSLDVVRDYIYIDDFVSGLKIIIQEREIRNSSVNLGTGIGVTTREIISEVNEQSGRIIKINHVKHSSIVIEKNVLDSTKLNAYGHEIKFSIKDGIACEISRIKGLLNE